MTDCLFVCPTQCPSVPDVPSSQTQREVTLSPFQWATMEKPNWKCESIKRNKDRLNNRRYFFCLDLRLIQATCLTCAQLYDAPLKRSICQTQIFSVAKYKAKYLVRHFQQREVSEVAFNIPQISANLMRDLKSQTEECSKANMDKKSWARSSGNADLCTVFMMTLRCPMAASLGVS